MNDSGRAPSGAITHARRQDRTTDELVGLCRGLLADGHVSQMEAEFLKDWIERNAEFVDQYPFNRIYSLLVRILSDGFIDQDESSDLHDTLIRFVGGEAIGESASLSSALPLCQPAPPAIHEGQVFVVTGTFSFGTRSLVSKTIEDKGGRVAGNVSQKINYLIIGELGSRDWINSNAGRKIQSAIELRDGGTAIRIISEQHWLAALR